MIQIKYKTNAQKCIEANSKAYKRKPVYKNAKQKRKEAKAMAEMIERNAVFSDIDFKMF